MTHSLPGIYRGTVVNSYDIDPDRMCWVVVPSVSGVNTQLAQLALFQQRVSHGTLVWVAYEHGDSGRPVVVALAPSVREDPDEHPSDETMKRKEVAT